MIEKITNSQIPDIYQQSPQRSDGPRPEDNADASLQVSYDSVIENATQIPPEQTDAVQQAQQLLLSGQLESPENILAAAENIVTFGI